jgi:cytochrome c peroxidase
MKMASLVVSTTLASFSFVPVSAQTRDNVIYLDQGWSQEDREWYWHASQGSAVLGYDIFLNLEAADSQDLFRANANLIRYGLIPDSVRGNNPDGLPVGIVKQPITTPIKGWPAGDYVGMSCAACHTGQLKYKGKLIRIEAGNSSTIDLQALTQGLDDALRATLADPAKFDRLASRLGASSPDAKDQLRKRVESDSERAHDYSATSAISRFRWGPGRLDALAEIFNRALATLSGIPQNSTIAVAPTKPPFLWNSPHGLWTEWRGTVQDPIKRNVQEAIGVYAAVDLSSKSPADGLFQSAISIPTLKRVEDQLERVAPPSWPEDLFGKIDRDKAKLGKALFIEHCANCHNVWPYRWTEPNKYGKRYILVGLVPLNYVGTDRGQFETIRPFLIAGALGNSLSKELLGDSYGKPLLPAGDFMNAVSFTVFDTAAQKANLTEDQVLDMHGYRVPGGGFSTTHPAEEVYKAGPRDGVWATAPFIHNGSVPNLYEMLLPAAERTKKFYVGGDFDPVKVGLDTKATSGTFLMDTTLPGNSNAGHSFENSPRGNGVVGPLLSEDDRWALVEYLKSIPEEAGRVTPFGGPPETNSPPKQ